MKIHTLGPSGTYSHETAIMIFGGSDSRLVFHERNMDIFTSLEDDPDEDSLAVVPIENSTAGLVDEVMGYWKKTIRNSKDDMVKPKINVCGEYGLPITHSLVSNTEGCKKIKRIFSHPQALGQCSENIRIIEINQGSSIEQIPTKSTALAATLLSQEGDMAICSHFCAQKAGLVVINPQFNDSNGNLTRFHVLSKKRHSLMGDANKTAILFYLRDEPQSEANASWSISAGRTNVTTAHSVAVGEPGVYAFYREFETGIDSEEGCRIIQRLSTFTIRILVLGSYSSHNSVKGGAK